MNIDFFKIVLGSSLDRQPLVLFGCAAPLGHGDLPLTFQVLPRQGAIDAACGAKIHNLAAVLPGPRSEV